MSFNMVFFSVVTGDINNDVVIEWQKSHTSFIWTITRLDYGSLIPKDLEINLMNTHMGRREEHAQFYERKNSDGA
jgi:hypothetical protein